jgi:hypothetical protein
MSATIMSVEFVIDTAAGSIRFVVFCPFSHASKGSPVARTPRQRLILHCLRVVPEMLTVGLPDSVPANRIHAQECVRDVVWLICDIFVHPVARE